MRTFIEEFRSLTDQRRSAVESLAQSSLPVVIYGAGSYAATVERYLNANGLVVAAKFVDDCYQVQPGVLHFEEIEQRFDRFCVVMGMADFRRGYSAIEARACAKVHSAHHFVLSPHYLDGVNFEFVTKHSAELQSVYENLADEMSKKTFLGYLKTQVTGDDQFILDVFCKNQYFQDFIPLNAEEVFVDAGAFTGDTLKAFCERTGGHYRKCYAFEPDPGNFRKLMEYISSAGLGDVLALPHGLGSRREVAQFSEAGGGVSTESKLCDVGGIAVEIDTIDSMCSDATFIKMDIEGAELDALHGSECTIRSNTPALAICAYHKPSHLWQLSDYVMSLVPSYKIYFRHHQTFSTELVMYAIRR